MSARDVSEASMLELFRRECEDHLQRLSLGLLALEKDPGAAAHLNACMRAAHSLKGAARIVGVEAGVRVAHGLESCFVAAKDGRVLLDAARIDCLLKALDLLREIARQEESELLLLETGPESEVARCVAVLEQCVGGVALTGEAKWQAAGPEARVMLEASELDELEGPCERAEEERPDREGRVEKGEPGEQALRVTAATLNRLLGLAGESRVDSRRLQPFAESLLSLKRLQLDLVSKLDEVQEGLKAESASAEVVRTLEAAVERARECHRGLSARLAEFETFEHRAVRLSQNLFDTALACRMRPFADGVRAFPRMVRDVARRLGKDVRMVVSGESTQIDRDILERLDAPLGHLLRNAVDHGMESPEERIGAGKAQEGTIHLIAEQRAGRLHVTVRDDGAGIDRDRIRKRVVERGLAAEATAATLSDAELFEFLLLPGFTLADRVTEISGRGVGLDAVSHMLKEVHGTVRISSERGRGTQFQLQLPLTLSVIRALIVEVAEELYAVPLTSIVRTVKLSRRALSMLEGRPHFDLGERPVGLVTAHELLDYPEVAGEGAELPVVVIGDEGRAFGVLVDRLLGARELVVYPLDARLGKVKNVSAASLMEDGSPVLIWDIDDVMRSVERLVTSDGLRSLSAGRETSGESSRKRVLVVEDSLTVRELERKLLSNAGYDVEIAVDGMDGWNAVRAGKFDLIVTDIDMPRMDGIELVRLIRQDPQAKSTPVMIVSYKDRPEDRARGLDAGADFYLAKGSFHDESLVQAALELIGRSDGRVDGRADGRAGA